MYKTLLTNVISILLSAAILSGCAPAGKLTATREILTWENEISQLERLDTLEEYPESAVLFTGSSSIRLWKTITEDMAPYPVIQRGFGGSKIEDMAWYLPRIVFPHRFSALVFFIGSNNLTGSKSDSHPRELAEMADRINQAVRSRYPETPIFWIAITPTNSRWKARGKIRKANALVRELCENSPDLYYIDTVDAFLGPDGRPRKELFMNDQLHLNREGYRIWAGIIKAELDKVLKRP